MQALGERWAQRLDGGQVIFLQGDLGAGKTTLVQGMLRGLGYSASVNSPTYTLVEPYSFSDFDVYHFDLYRLESADELEAIGAREYFHARAVCLIEWPQRAAGWLPTADVEIVICHQAAAREVACSAGWA